eukprot:2916848-Rhodomonas_salina.1
MGMHCELWLCQCQCVSVPGHAHFFPKSDQVTGTCATCQWEGIEIGGPQGLAQYKSPTQAGRRLR